jgi:hypothetical protein
MLRMSNPELRRQLAEVMTLQCWTRLMPDAYDETVEVLGEVERLRPDWLRREAERPIWRANFDDWQATGDFWRRVRQQPEVVAAHLSSLGDSEVMATARAEAKQARSEGQSVGLKFDLIETAGSSGRFSEPVDGWNGDDVDVWRLEALGWASISFESNPYAEWLMETLDLPAAGFPLGPGWVRFWLYDVRAERVPRWWIRSAWKMFQRTRTVTAGTPCDGQLSTYLYSCDVFLTCDRAFRDILDRCRRDSPAPMAMPLLISPGQAKELQVIVDGLRRQIAGQLTP